MTSTDFTSLRRAMVEQQLRARGIRDEAVLRVMGETPRERFLPESERAYAYEDRAVAIGHDQSISQPYIVAFMTETLEVRPDHRVLEIGAGSGYQAAILAQLAAQVVSVERIFALCETAAANLEGVGIHNVTIRQGDGSVGLAEPAALFDRILVTAGAPQIPRALLSQLAEGGRLVIPVGGQRAQTISLVVRCGPRLIETPLLACRFVKLIGCEGWASQEPSPG